MKYLKYFCALHELRYCKNWWLKQGGGAELFVKDCLRMNLYQTITDKQPTNDTETCSCRFDLDTFVRHYGLPFTNTFASIPTLSSFRR